MAKEMQIKSPFRQCEKGHDLTAPNAYIYDSGGRRSCRQCATVDGKKGTRSARRSKGVFT